MPKTVKDESYYPKEVLTPNERKRLQKAYEDKPNVTYRTTGKQQLLENQTTRTKQSGAALLKSIKRRMLKGIPGTKNKSY